MRRSRWPSAPRAGSPSTSFDRSAPPPAEAPHGGKGGGVVVTVGRSREHYDCRQLSISSSRSGIRAGVRCEGSGANAAMAWWSFWADLRMVCVWSGPGRVPGAGVRAGGGGLCHVRLHPQRHRHLHGLPPQPSRLRRGTATPRRHGICGGGEVAAWVPDSSKSIRCKEVGSPALRGRMWPLTDVVH
jgi:hypothetical protein